MLKKQCIKSGPNLTATANSNSYLEHETKSVHQVGRRQKIFLAWKMQQRHVTFTCKTTSHILKSALHFEMTGKGSQCHPKPKHIRTSDHEAARGEVFPCWCSLRHLQRRKQDTWSHLVAMEAWELCIIQQDVSASSPDHGRPTRR